MIDNAQPSKSEISITVKRSYGKSQPQSLLLQPDNFNASDLFLEVKFARREDSKKDLNLLKSFLLLIVISQLPLEALDEAVETLEQIREFYSDLSPESERSTLTTKVVTGKIVSTETRDPIVLAWD